VSLRPSEPILSWLRNALKAKELNVAALAEKTGESRRDIKKVLSGREPLTVDQLMSWTKALELSMEELVSVPEELPEPAPEMVVDDERFVVDPWGIQAEQSIRLGFAMGADFTILARTEELKDSGLPETTLANAAFAQVMPIRLEAAYHRYNKPDYDAQGVTLTLSFDTIRHCRFPWSSIVEVRFHVLPPEPSEPDDDEPELDGGNVVKLFG
jgi:transcriptional regulator with XRE-family HTH domain